MCDTFIALPPATRDGSVIFAKNSDRPAGEGQNIHNYPAARHPSDEALKCTYIEIPQAERTYGVLLSQIDWMWAAEMGANDCGVVIGNEGGWTRLARGPPMDYRDNPQCRILLHRRWCTFTPATGVFLLRR